MVKRRIRRRLTGGQATAPPYGKRVKLINVQSQILPPAEAMSMFSTQPTQNPDVLQVRQVAYRPTTSLDDRNDIIEILMTGSFNEYVRPKDMRLRIKGKIVKADGTDMTHKVIGRAAGDGVTAITAVTGDHEKLTLSWMGMYGFFSDQQVYVNGEMIDTSNNQFQHRAATYLRTHVDTKQLENEYNFAGVVTSYPQNLDNYTETANVRDNVYEKTQDIYNSKEFTYTGRIMTPLCECTGYLPTNTEIRFVWKKSDAKHYLNCADADADKWMLKITSMELLVPKLRLDPALAMNLEARMQQGPAKFPMRNWTTTFISMAQGQKQIIQEGWMSGDSPLYIIATMIDPARFHGKASLSSTKYDEFNLREMKICLEDEHERRLPIKITPDDKSQAVLTLLESLGYLDPMNYKKCLIGRNNFKDLPVFFFNETNDTVIHSDVYSEMKAGNQRIELELETPHNGTIIIVLHCIFQAELKIFADRRVMFHNKAAS